MVYPALNRFATPLYPIAYRIVLLSTLLSIPMFATGLGGPDFYPHLRWSAAFDQQLHAGIWYPRWLPDANYGYGNPTFFFHGPIFYYAVALAHLVVPDILSAMKTACWFGFVLSGATMYLFAREFHCRRASGWAAVAYIVLPYHAMDLYSRTALAEFWAFAWVPLVFLCTWRAWQGRPYGVPGLAVSCALVSLTHLCSALLTILTLSAYATYLAVFQTVVRSGADAGTGADPGVPGRQRCLRLGVGVALGLGLSAIYLLPAALEQSYVQMRLSTALPFGNVLNNFLFNHPWYALGFSIEVSLGAMLMLALLVCFLYMFWFRGPESGTKEAGLSGDSVLSQPHAAFWAIVGLWTILLTTETARPLWKVVPVLPAIQFPWRWLIITTFAVSAALPAALRRWQISPKDLRGQLLSRFLAAGFLLIFAPGIAWLGVFLRYDDLPRDPVPLPRIAEIKKTMTDSQLYRVLPALNRDHGWDILEFRPVWAPLALPAIAPPVSWVRGSGTLEVQDWAPLQRRVRIATGHAGYLKLRTFYYPGWTARLNGQPTAIWPDPGDGSISLGVTAGTHQLQVEWTGTAVQQAGKVISSLALLVLFALGGYEWWMTRKDW